MTNNELANRLREQARLLRMQNRNLFRVKAYRQAAETLQRLDRPIEELVHEKGTVALEELPGIGKKLAATISRYLETGGLDGRN